MAVVKRTKPNSYGDDWQLPAELRLANGDKIICTKLLHHLPQKRSVFMGRWQSKPVLIKLMLNKRRSVYDAWREQSGYRILTLLQINTPKLYFHAPCEGKHVVVFEFLRAQTLHELWQTQPSRRTQIAEWSINLFVKLHRNGYRHVDFHLNNFLVVDDVFYVIDLRSVRKASRSLRMRSLFYVSKKYGYWQRHYLAQCFSLFNPVIFQIMMDALRRGYPEAANDPELAPAIIHATKRRAARRAELIVCDDDCQLPVELRLANFDTLHCTQMLRLLPGKRAVMKAQWQGRTVLVKLMLNTASGARNTQREMAGYEILTAAKITTPKLLLKTRVDDKSHVLIFEFLQQERSISELWRDHAEQRPQIARDCLQLIARMHAQTCCQNDLHLDNFLLTDTQIYVIDFASVSHHATTVYGKWQRRNLALFLALFAPLPRKILLDALQKSYPAAAADDKLAYAIGRASQRSKSRYLKKCFRKCSEFSVRKNWREFAVWNRAYECEDLLSFVKNPEAWMAKGEFLKDGTSATVVRVTMTGMRGVYEKTVVIKRNNIKNIFHGLRNCLRATRSHINWRNVHLLKISGIETPAPIALVEKRWGPFRLRGYYVSEFNSFPTVAQKYESQMPSEDELMWFAEFFTSMRLARLYHGDLKASNLFVTDHGVAVIDYDSLKQCSEKNIHRFMYKDHQRFLKNWRDKPQHLKLFSMILGQGGA